MQKKNRKYRFKNGKDQNGRLASSSKCVVYGFKKSRFMKKQEAKGLLGNLGIRTPLSKISFLGDIFF